MNTSPSPDTRPEPVVKKVVLTGGPCAGKSSAQPLLTEHFTSRGWDVFLVPEVATLLINGGLRPREMTPAAYFQWQRSLVTTQLALEDSFNRQAKTSGRRSLIVCDRGAADPSAYCDPVMWGGVLASLGLNEVAVRDQRYDAVLHMVTAADGAREFYTLANNTARSETPAEAVALDRRTMQAWVGHPHLRVIGNHGSFDAKMAEVLKEVGTVIGEPVPVEKERKFLAAIVPGVERPHGESFQVVQHYLPAADGKELRIRRRGRNGNWLFTQTAKERAPDGDGRVERERILSHDEYFDLLGRNLQAPYVEKTRTVFISDGIYYEMDEYAKPAGVGPVVEVETDRKGPIPLPPFLKLVREVTDDKSFSNAALANTRAPLRPLNSPAPQVAGVGQQLG